MFIGNKLQQDMIERSALPETFQIVHVTDQMELVHCPVYFLVVAKHINRFYVFQYAMVEKQSQTEFFVNMEWSSNEVDMSSQDTAKFIRLNQLRTPFEPHLYREHLSHLLLSKQSPSASKIHMIGKNYLMFDSGWSLTVKGIAYADYYSIEVDEERLLGKEFDLTNQNNYYAGSEGFILKAKNGELVAVRITPEYRNNGYFQKTPKLQVSSNISPIHQTSVSCVDRNKN